MTDTVLHTDFANRDARANMSGDTKKARFGGVGASECAAVLGLSEWRTAVDVYAAKVAGEAYGADTDSEAMLWGRVLEELILEAYAKKRDCNVVVRPPAVWNTSIKYDGEAFMFANLDGFAVRNTLIPAGSRPLEALKDAIRLVEAKTSNTADGWGEEGTDQVPTGYLIQAMHQLMCVRPYAPQVTECDIAVLIKGNDFRIYTIKFNPKLAAVIEEKLTDFWGRVKHRNPPAPQAVGDADKVYRFPRVGTRVTADPACVVTWQAYVNAKRELAAAEEAVKGHGEALKRFMGEAELLVTDDGKLLSSWKQQSRKGFDAKLFASQHAELHSAFTRETTFRVFRTHEGKDA